MDRILHFKVRLNCDPQRAFEMFTVNRNLESWLVNSADVEPVAGGKYELFWNPSDRENNSTIGCKIMAIEPDRLLTFEWKGPVEFKAFMNDADPLTHVTVCFVPIQEGSSRQTEVHVVHSGWRSDSRWEEARSWFDRAWNGALGELVKRVNEK